MLDRVTYPNGAYTKFDYNKLGQVWKVSNYAADNTLLNYTATNTDNSVLGTNLLDVPRFSQTKLWAKDFNSNQEVVIPNLLQTGQSYNVSGVTGTGTLVQVTAPDGTISKAFYHETGWNEGLPVVTEDWANSTRQRWTWTNWTQDNTALAYVLNPRVTESKVGDSSNTKRTTVSYHLTSGNISKYGLVNEVKVYDADQSTVLKTSQTTYNESTTYTSRRIIGLPSQTLLYDQSSNLMSKVTYAYDEGNFGDSSLQQNIAPINHDYANYSSSFIQGRGNLTSATRWDVTQPTNGSAASTSQIKYNTAGSPVAQINPLNNQVKMSYADSFNDSINRNSYAYPTTVYDPAGNYSQVKYRYDIGANVWAKSPAPAGNTSGKETEREYDSLGRLTKDKIVNTGAYTRYEYFTNGVQSRVYATITDTNGNNTGDSADEVLSESWTDGAGRVLKSGTEHPGSAGGYAATLVEYDIMGRVKKSSVPTEINTNWTPTGDDATRGFLWTQREYDWKGRVTKEINTDGTDKIYSYDGCGCAGGQVTTIKGEYITETDWYGNTTANLGRRTQKVYADILGRAYKSEILNWDNTVYSSTQTTFNGRDQATEVKRFAGTVYSSTYQTMTMTYDGHGRLSTRHTPQQNTGAATVYNYYSDDSIQSVTDARGAAVNYLYNSRGLPTQVSYAVPTGVAATPTVSIAYDALGNPTQTIDGMGTTDFTYNQLSQITSETRSFNDTLADAPSGGFALTYEYTISGQLKSIKDPYQDKINYTHDKTGRLTSVDGATAFGGVTNYADNPHYRAWGALQSLDYGNDLRMEMTFNNRLQADTFKLTDPTTSATYMDKEYAYYGDGRLKKLNDNILYESLGGQKDSFDRLTTYDHVGRPKVGLSGTEARGGTVAQADKENEVPYHQSYQFNEFGNMTQRLNEHWGKTSWYGENFNLSYTYQNNRITNSGWVYDADGRVLTSAAPDDATEMTYDAKGQISRLLKAWSSDVYRYYDGGGREVKRRMLNWVENQNGVGGSWVEEDAKYFIRSSVLGGQTITEVGSTGRKSRTYVMAAGTVLAWQNQGFYNNTENEYVNFQYSDASGFSERSANKDGTVFGNYDAEGAAVERDPLGGNVGIFTPYFQLNSSPPEPESPLLQPMSEWGENSNNPNAVTYMLDGIRVPASIAHSALRSGAAEIDRWATDPAALRAAGIYAPTYGDDGGEDACVNGRCPDQVTTTGTTSYYWIADPFNQNSDARNNHENGGGGSSSPPDACDDYLSRTLGGEGAYFFDHTTHSFDEVMGNRITSGTKYGNDNHLYGGLDEESIKKGTEMYAPPGFEPVVPANNTAARNVDGLPNSKFLGRENKTDGSYSQNYVMFFNKERGLTLVAWHVDDFNIVKMEDGRTRFGRTGISALSGGAITDKDGTLRGSHGHWDLYETKGAIEYLPGLFPKSGQTESPRQRIRRSFRLLCPESIR